MATCDYCEQEIHTADGCIDAPIVIDGYPYSPIRFGEEAHPLRMPRCGDCNVLPGQVHHHGCDIEECPACGDQSIGCDCRWAGEEDEYEDDDWGWGDDRPFGYCPLCRAAEERRADQGATRPAQFG